MDKLTKEQRKALQVFEKHLRTAYYGSYIHGMTLLEAKELFNIYNELFGKKETAYSCSHCRLRITKLLGQKYYSSTLNGKTETRNRTKGRGNRGNDRAIPKGVLGE